MPAARPGTREALIEAARRRFVDQGIVATSLDEIAQDVGVHRVTLHRYFPAGRNELVGEAVLAMTLEVLAEESKRLDAAASTAEGFAHLFAALVHEVRTDPVALEAIGTIQDRMDLDEVGLASILPAASELWSDIVRRSATEDLRARQDLEPSAVVRHVVRLVESLAMHPESLVERESVLEYYRLFVEPALFRPRHCFD